jgi:Tfp pilus assembly protein PilV
MRRFARRVGVRGEEGFTVIEILVAALILTVGILTTFTVLDSSRRLTLVAEHQTTMAQRAQAELERVQSLPYSQVALTGSSTSWSTTPGNSTYVGGTAGACPVSPSGPAPTYQPDHRKGGSTATEPLVINGCSYQTTVNGTNTTITPTTGAIAPVTSWSTSQNNGSTISGNVYDFITWAADPSCSQTPTPGSACSTTNDYKRVTIVVTIAGAAQPTNPAIVSALVTSPSTGRNPVSGSGTTCTNAQGQTVSCTSNPCDGCTPIQYFPCDSSYSSSSCTTPPCSGNVLDNTLETVGATPPTPDGLGSSFPTGTCTGTPCYATDVGCGSGGGLPLPPCTTDCVTLTGSPPCYKPPPNNSESHSWLTPAIAAGNTWHLTGKGNMTTYLESTTGSSTNVTLCVGLFVVQGSVLGTTGGNLLAVQIGGAAAVSASATAGVPTPVTFDFDTGSGTYAVASTGTTHIELVVWVASTSAPVDLVYDQASAASQVTLMTLS